MNSPAKWAGAYRRLPNCSRNLLQLPSAKVIRAYYLREPGLVKRSVETNSALEQSNGPH
jgi:hypothetical protein